MFYFEYKLISLSFWLMNGKPVWNSSSPFSPENTGPVWWLHLHCLLCFYQIMQSWNNLEVNRLRSALQLVLSEQSKRKFLAFNNSLKKKTTTLILKNFYFSGNKLAMQFMNFQVQLLRKKLKRMKKYIVYLWNILRLRILFSLS